MPLRSRHVHALQDLKITIGLVQVPDFDHRRGFRTHGHPQIQMTPDLAVILSELQWCRPQ